MPIEEGFQAKPNGFWRSSYALLCSLLKQHVDSSMFQSRKHQRVTIHQDTISLIAPGNIRPRDGEAMPLPQCRRWVFGTGPQLIGELIEV